MECKLENRQFLARLYAKLAVEDRFANGIARDFSLLFSEARSTGYSEQDLRWIPKEAIKGLGCCNPLDSAEIKPGQVVLDLGSGSGIDCFLAAHIVGRKGMVIGIDMTDEMLRLSMNIAKTNGFRNIFFHRGRIEELPIKDNSADRIISNCVFNHVRKKHSAFKETYRVLKSGGIMLTGVMAKEGELSEYQKWCYKSWTGDRSRLVSVKQYISIISSVGFKDTKIIRENSFPELGLRRQTSGKIKGVLFKSYR